MDDNQIPGQQAWVVVEVGHRVVMNLEEVTEHLRHVWNDTDAEWLRYLRGLPK